MVLRREFALSEADQKFLDDYGCPWETIMDGSPWVLIHEFFTHDGYNHERVTAAIRIETGYPDAQLDMVYVYPALARKDGHAIGATQATQVVNGISFQRWSRHRTAKNPWVKGKDNLGSHVLLIEDWFTREFEK